MDNRGRISSRYLDIRNSQLELREQPVLLLARTTAMEQDP